MKSVEDLSYDLSAVMIKDEIHGTQNKAPRAILFLSPNLSRTIVDVIAPTAIESDIIAFEYCPSLP